MARKPPHSPHEAPHGGAPASHEPNVGGRPTDCFWLNEEQALFLCTRSEAKGAVKLTKQMVMTFAAWRNGRLADLMPPPAAPQRIIQSLHPEADTWRGIVREARILFGKEAAAVLWNQSSLPDIDLPDDLQKMPERFDIERFLVEACDITGNHRDFTTSRDLIDELIDWLYDQDAPPMGSRSASLRLKALAGTWRHPQTGRTFSPAKQRVSGYRGIRLTASADHFIESAEADANRCRAKTQTTPDHKGDNDHAI